MYVCIHVHIHVHVCICMYNVHVHVCVDVQYTYTYGCTMYMYMHMQYAHMYRPASNHITVSHWNNNWTIQRTGYILYCPKHPVEIHVYSALAYVKVGRKERQPRHTHNAMNIHVHVQVH